MSRLLSSNAEQGRWGRASVGLIISIALFIPALRCLLHSPVADHDVWWHVRAGQWIVEHGTLPTVDAFSTYGHGQPWTAYSWVVELILYGLHSALGLRGLLFYTAILSVAIAVALFCLIRRMRPPGYLDVIFVLVATVGLLPVLTPRPWLVSILLFVIELDILLTAGRTGNRRVLLWLIPLFVLWANTHIQFVLGLVVLAAAVAEPVLSRIVPGHLVDEDSRSIPFRWMLLVFVLCLAATLVNPYHIHLYFVAAQLMGQSQLWNLIEELVAMPFRTPRGWVVLAVTIGSAMVVGWRRKVRLLLAILFVISVYFSFRSQRDAWLVLVVGLTTLAYCIPRPEIASPRGGNQLGWIVPTLGLVTFAGCMVVGEARLREDVNKEFPAGAVEFIAAGDYSGPMFNSFGWGGYLILHLPELPVSIDGRTMVHGQDRLVRNFCTLRGAEQWQDDSELAEAKLVVLPRKEPLVALLKQDQRFFLVYEDSVSVVFSANEGRDAQSQFAVSQKPQFRSQ